MFGGVVELKSAHNAPRLNRRECFVEAAGCMDVQVIQYEPNAFCFQTQLAYRVAHTENKVEFGAPLGHFDMPLPSIRLEEDEQIAGAISFVLEVVALRMTRLSWQRYTCFTNELLRLFVKADNGKPRSYASA